MKEAEVFSTLLLSQPGSAVTAAHLEEPRQQFRALRAERVCLLALTIASERFRFHSFREQPAFQAEQVRFTFQLERLSLLGMERFLGRAVRRNGPQSLRQLAQTLESSGQRTWDVLTVLRSPAIIRFGQCTPGAYTLLPWERLQVPWRGVRGQHLSMPEYETLSTAFWVHHRHVPSLEEEPSPAVRTRTAEQLRHHQQRGEAGPYAYLVPDPEGPLELEVQGARQRFQVNPGGLRPGHLGNIWMDGERREVHVGLTRDVEQKLTLSNC